MVFDRLWCCGWNRVSPTPLFGGISNLWRSTQSEHDQQNHQPIWKRECVERRHLLLKEKQMSLVFFLHSDGITSHAGIVITVLSWLFCWVVQKSRAEESFVLFECYPAKGKPGHPVNTGNYLNDFKTIRKWRKLAVINYNVPAAANAQLELNASNVWEEVDISYNLEKNSNKEVSKLVNIQVCMYVCIYSEANYFKATHKSTNCFE